MARAGLGISATVLHSWARSSVRGTRAVARAASVPVELRDRRGSGAVAGRVPEAQSMRRSARCAPDAQR
eukprot:3050642-Alexandrium_andersonii.AAC.1